MTKTSVPTSSVQWLSLKRSGEKNFDFTCETTTFRLQTRMDGGVDLVLVGKDNAGGLTHAKCDLSAVICAVSECIASHRFEGITDVIPKVMIRGHIDSTSEDLSKKTTSLAAIPQNTAQLNQEKWEREVAYLGPVDV
jgi:hypothetical protein